MILFTFRNVERLVILYKVFNLLHLLGRVAVQIISVFVMAPLDTLIITHSALVVASRRLIVGSMRVLCSFGVKKIAMIRGFPWPITLQVGNLAAWDLALKVCTRIATCILEALSEGCNRSMELMFVLLQLLVKVLLVLYKRPVLRHCRLSAYAWLDLIVDMMFLHSNLLIGGRGRMSAFR